MLVVGVIIALIGFGGLIYGIVQNSSMEAQLKSLFLGGNGDPGTVFIIIGAVVIAVGLVFIFVSVLKKKKADSE